VIFAITAIIMRLARAVALWKLGRMSYTANILFWIVAFVEILGYCAFSLCLSVHPDDNIYIHVLGFCFFVFAVSVCSSIRNTIWRLNYGLERSKMYNIMMNIWYSLYVVVSIVAIMCLAQIPFYEHLPLKAITPIIDTSWSIMFLATIFVNFLEGYGDGFLKISFEFIDQDHPDFNDDIQLFAFADGHLDQKDVDDFKRDIEETSWNDMIMRNWTVSYFIFFTGLFIMTKSKAYVGCTSINYLPVWNLFQYFIQLGTVIAGSMMSLFYLPSYWRLLHKDQSKTERNFARYFTCLGGFFFGLGNGIMAVQRLVYHTIPEVSSVAGFGICTFMQFMGLTYGFSFVYHPNFPKYTWAQRMSYKAFGTVVIVSILVRILALLTGDFKRYYQGATGCPVSQLFESAQVHDELL